MNEKAKSFAWKIIKLFASLNLAFWVLGLVPYFLFWIGFNFLPAPDPFVPIPTWSHWFIGGLLALPFAVFLSYFSFVTFSWEKPWGSLIMLISGPFMIFMTGFSVNVTLGAFVPLIHTTIFGEMGAIEYRVNSPHGSSYLVYNCYAAIEVYTSVYGLSELCGFEYEGRGNIQKGTRLKVSGKASRAGVFYKSYTIIEN